MKLLLPIFGFYKIKSNFSTKIINNLENSKGLIFNFGVTSLPHREKRAKGGEDASCASKEILSVADGVGGWSEYGIDPSLYSNNLCSNILEYYNSYKSLPLIQIFIKACENIKHRGSSTCTIATVITKDNKNYVQGLNLGDSGYLILRPIQKEENNIEIQVIYKTEEQTHGFNFPYQVGERGDNPSTAEVKDHEVEKNDIIILASDGLWDNLNVDQLVFLLKKYYEIEMKELNNENIVKENGVIIYRPKILSEIITNSAENVSLDPSYKSPFSIRSRGAYLGGKHDDITVIVAQLIEDNTNTKF
jgi:protein phosphatase PTC7